MCCSLILPVVQRRQQQDSHAIIFVLCSPDKSTKYLVNIGLCAHGRQLQRRHMKCRSICAVLPINMTGNRVEQTAAQADVSDYAATSTFSKLTVSNIARGSVYYWCACLPNSLLQSSLFLGS